MADALDRWVQAQKRRARGRRLTIKGKVKKTGLPEFFGKHPGWKYLQDADELAVTTQQEVYEDWLELLERFTRVRSEDSVLKQLDEVSKRSKARYRKLYDTSMALYPEGDESTLQKIYQEAWRRGYESSGEAFGGEVKISPYQKKRLAAKAERARFQFQKFFNTLRDSTDDFGYEIEQTVLPSATTGRGVTRISAHEVKGISELGQFQQRILKGTETVIMVDPITDRAYKARLTGRRPIYAEELTVTRRTEDAFGMTIDSHQRKIQLADAHRRVYKGTMTDVWNDSFLQGAERAAKDKGIDPKSLFVQVLDGPECGWKSHDDTQKAHGMVVTVAEARRHLIAHPHCVRQFINQTEPKTKSGKQRQKKAQGELQTQTSKKLNSRTVLKGATGVAGAYLASAVIRAAVANVPELIKRYGSDMVAATPTWKTFEAQIQSLTDEMVLAQNSGKPVFSEGGYLDIGALKNNMPRPVTTPGVVSRRTVRNRVDDAVEGAAVNGKPLPPFAERVLRTQGKTDLEIDEILEDWADYKSYVDETNLTLTQALEREHVVALAHEDFLLGFPDDDLAALRFHLSMPQGVNVGGISRDSFRRVKNYFQTRDIEQVYEETVKNLATAIDPFPVIKADFGKATAWIRVSTEGRRRIATQLWDRHRIKLIDRKLDDLVDAEYRKVVTDLDRERIRRRWGGEDPPAVTLKDIFDALLPRITLNPGGIFSATIARVNGSVQYAGKFLGKGKLSWLQVENRFRKATLNSIIEGLREGRLNAAKVKEILQEEAITDFTLFRNSPLAARARFYGLGLQSLASKLVPAKEFARIRNRLQFFSWSRFNERSLSSYHRWLDLKERKALSPDGIIGFETRTKTLRMPDGTRRTQTFQHNLDTEFETLNSIWSQRVVRGGTEYDPLYFRNLKNRGVLTDIVAFPGRAARVVYHRGISGASETFFKLSLWRGSLVQVARAFRVHIDTARELYHRGRSLFANTLDNLDLNKIRTLGSWDEVVRYFGNITKENPIARIQTIDAGLPPVRTIEGVTDKMKPFVQDVSRMDHWILRNAPWVKLPAVKVVDDLGVASRYSYKTKEILVDSKVASEWAGVHTRIRIKGVGTGWFPDGTDIAPATLAHEYGHYILDQLSPEQYGRLWRTFFGIDMRQYQHILSDPSAKLWDGLDRAYMEIVTRPGAATLKSEIDEAVGRWMNLATNNRRIRGGIGGQAAVGPREMMAELFSEYMTSPRPRNPATIMGSELIESFGRGGGIRRIPVDPNSYLIHAINERYEYANIRPGIDDFEFLLTNPKLIKSLEKLGYLKRVSRKIGEDEYEFFLFQKQNYTIRRSVDGKEIFTGDLPDIITQSPLMDLLDERDDILQEMIMIRSERAVGLTAAESLSDARRRAPIDLAYFDSELDPKSAETLQDWLDSLEWAAKLYDDEIESFSELAPIFNTLFRKEGRDYWKTISNYKARLKEIEPVRGPAGGAVKQTDTVAEIMQAAIGSFWDGRQYRKMTPGTLWFRGEHKGVRIYGASLQRGHLGLRPMFASVEPEDIQKGGDWTNEIVVMHMQIDKVRERWGLEDLPIPDIVVTQMDQKALAYWAPDKQPYINMGTGFFGRRQAAADAARHAQTKYIEALMDRKKVYDRMGWPAFDVPPYTPRWLAEQFPEDQSLTVLAYGSPAPHEIGHGLSIPILEMLPMADRRFTERFLDLLEELDIWVWNSRIRNQAGSLSLSRTNFKRSGLEEAMSDRIDEIIDSLERVVFDTSGTVSEKERLSMVKRVFPDLLDTDDVVDLRSALDKAYRLRGNLIDEKWLNENFRGIHSHPLRKKLLKALDLSGWVNVSREKIMSMMETPWGLDVIKDMLSNDTEILRNPSLDGIVSGYGGTSFVEFLAELHSSFIFDLGRAEPYAKPMMTFLKDLLQHIMEKYPDDGEAIIRKMIQGR